MPDFIENKGQMRAIRHKDGPMLVLAGPGSGKTFVITHRIAYLISECKIPPNNILVITFTKAAALEMQARANQLIGGSAYVSFGTFHSVFYQILKKSDQYRSLTLVSEQERHAFFKAFLSEQVTKEESEEVSERLLKQISQRKNSILEESDSGKKEMRESRKGEQKEERKEKSQQLFEEAYSAYNDWLLENKKLDFDDMLRLCFSYLSKNQAEQTKWQKQFLYILIDEFQDMNPLQYETIKLLCSNQNIFAVGDDDQAIYGFRGSNPSLMRQFTKEYQAEMVNLSYNYRSCKGIVALAAKSIGFNQNRFPKQIQAVREGKEEIRMYGFEKKEEMITFLARETMAYAARFPEKTQAVLARTNAEARLYGRLIGKSAESTVWQDLYAYLSFINTGRKRNDFLKIMNKPMRYIARGIAAEEIVDFDAMKRRLSEQVWIRKRVALLENQVTFAGKLDLYGQLHYIWKAMEYEKYVREVCKGDVMRLKESIGELARIAEFAKACKNLEELEEKMNGGRMKVASVCKGINGKEDAAANGDNSSIRVMTYHGAKGLEFDRVYLPGLNYGKVPHGRMLKSEELEEERRMFYVALTRAKSSLIFMYEESKKGDTGSKTESISPFVSEIMDLRRI